MNNNQTAVITSLTSLREELSSLATTGENGARVIALSQAFDRLMMGYQNGEYDASTIESGISEIRGELRSASGSRPLMPGAVSNLRDEVVSRNSRALAERLLSSGRGTWDSRHVEIVQGAIQQLARASSPDAAEMAVSLQKRMSDSVWLGNLELAETRAEVEAESRSLEQDLLSMLKNRSSEPVPFEMEESERVLASEPEKAVANAVSRANMDVVRSQMMADAQSLKLSKAYIEQMAASAPSVPADNAALERAAESIREAGARLLHDEYAKIGSVYKKVLAAMQGAISPEIAEQLTHGLDAAMNMQAADAEAVLSQINKVRGLIQPLAAQHSELRAAVSDIDRIQWRVNMLNSIASETAEMPKAEATTNAAQLLDARMLFEQKRMQFERNPEYRQAAPELMKALDFEIETPDYSARPSASQAVIDSGIRRIRQVAQSAAAGDIGMYAPVAGAELVKNSAPAIRMADQKTPTATFIPTIQSALAHRSNRVMRDARQIAYQPSFRADMGFATPRYEMENAQQPLFKRVRLSKDNSRANAILPALYKVAGIKVKQDQKTDKPLRKAMSGLNLTAANFEIIKIIEKQYGNKSESRASDTFGGANLDSGQSMHNGENTHDKVAGMLSDWLERRHDIKSASADTVDMIKTGSMSQSSAESKLNSEGHLLPTSVQQKLSPFLGFDISKVRIFSGPVAAMAAEAMGAHAFTVGTSIFLGKNKLNYDTAEGLSLLAHELQHTSHFASSNSVDSKEQEAEGVEARVKKAFGTTVDKFLALEKNMDQVTAAPNLAKDSVDTMAANSVGARYKYDPDEVYDAVCEKVLELMNDSMSTEKERNGKE